MDLLDANMMWNIDETSTMQQQIDHNNYTSPVQLSSPLSHSSNYSMDSGFLEPMTSPSHMMNSGCHTNNSMQYIDQNTGNQMNVNSCYSEQYEQSVPVASIAFSPPTVPSTTTNTFRQVNPENIAKPLLEIVEQPMDKPFRFRYKSEMHGTHGSLMGSLSERTKRTYPAVALRNFNFAPRAIIRCSLYQVPDASNVTDKRYPHSHKLIIKRGEIEECDPHDFEVSSQNDFTAVFQGMGIIHTTRKSIKEELIKKMRREKEFEMNRLLDANEVTEIERQSSKQAQKMNLNQVCLCFQAYIKNEIDNVWVKVCEPVYSNAINNMKAAVTGELRIVKMSTCVSPASGGQEIFLFVEKVCRNNIQVKFFEVGDNGEEGQWTALGIFNETDVHHQYGIVLKTPPYRDQQIQSPVTVMIQLCRPSDGCLSEAYEFRYKPNVQAGAKRKRTDSIDTIPTVVHSHEAANQESPGSFGGTSRQNDDSQQTFKKEYYQNDSTQQHHDMHDWSSFGNETLPSYFGTFSTSELSLTSNDLKGFWQISPEDFCRLLDVEIGGDSKLETDGAGSAMTESTQSSAEHSIHYSLLDKLKMLIKLFKNNYDDKKLKEMMTVLVDAQAETGENVLLDCIQSGTVDEIKDLVLILIKYKLTDILHSTNDVDQNCLHVSILNNQTKLLRIFLNMGVDVNYLDAFGQTPLHYAVQQGSEDSVRDLVESICINLNELNDDGLTPLHLAIASSNLEIIQTLIQAGANIQKKSPLTGNNVLHFAVEMEDFNMDIIKCLIQADETLLHHENNSRMNALQLASNLNQPEALLQYLASFYEQSYTKMPTAAKESDSESDSDNEFVNDRLFDDTCIMELSAIFDKDEKWKDLLIIMDLENKIAEWENLKSPSRALFGYLQRSQKSLDFLLENFDMLEMHRAISVVDEMLVRKCNK